LPSVPLLELAMALSYHNEADKSTAATFVDQFAKDTSLAVLSPKDGLFQARQDSYWSRTAAINVEPKCIVQPKSAQQVSEALKALNQRAEQFAVRSGGHMPGAGSNNIAGGVTIDLGQMDWTRFDAASETVDIGPGSRWLSVYTELQRHGRVVAGGRDGNVGVAGLLLGGGISYFTARHGFGCDNVIAYEVVLADGRIVTADAENHVDFFRALKGGCCNFGIVTNFRMRTFRCGKAWGGITFYPKEAAPQAITALVHFTDRIESDPDSNLLCFFAYAGKSSAVVVLQYTVQC
jgi:FAD/FMN-containing dehydrogenase